MSGCQKLSDEDSRDVEEEDDPEDEESFSEVKSSVDCVGRRNWRVRIFITPPDSSYRQKTLNNKHSALPINFTPQHWRLAEDMENIIRADFAILSDSKGNLFHGQVSK